MAERVRFLERPRALLLISITLKVGVERSRDSAIGSVAGQLNASMSASVPACHRGSLQSGGASPRCCTYWAVADAWLLTELSVSTPMSKVPLPGTPQSFQAAPT
jgi:hypothetical protein